MEVVINGVRFLPDRKRHLDKKPFNILIKEARLLKQETLEHVAQAIGTTKSRMWELEKGGTTPTLPILQKILTYYGIEFDEISEQ